MQRATAVIRRAELAGRITVDTITLDRAARYRRRIAMTTDRGHELMLDLPEATYMADGDALQLESGGLVRVRAAAEPLVEIRAPDPAALARIAWHIGNRHTPAEVTATAIYIQPDHVLEEMVVGLGARVHRIERPFEPEGGAYGGRGPLDDGHHHHSHQHAPHDHGPEHGDHHDVHSGDLPPARSPGSKPRVRRPG